MEGKVWTPSQEFMDKFNADRAAEMGVSVEQYKKELTEQAERVWCKCGNPSGNVYYHADGETTNDSCTSKHHWHCGDCNKVVQIG